MTETSPSKFRIKTMSFELEFEGSEAFLQNQVLKLTKSFQDVSFNGAIINYSQPSITKVSEEASLTVDFTLSTADIAAKIKVKSGRDLVIAAMAKLHFTDKKQTFLRKEILDEMKSASNHYNRNYSASLSASLDRLQKAQTIHTPSKGSYSLAQKEVERLKEELSIAT